jgi:hypothetical protein
MIIDNESICTMISSKDYREFQIMYTQKLLNNPEINEGQKMVGNNKLEFHQQTGFRMLVFSKKSKENLENYLIPKDIRFDVLRSLPNRKDIIQIDENNCIKYLKTDDRVDFITCYRKNKTQGKDLTNDDLIHTHYFTINLVTEQIGFDENNTYNNHKFKSTQELIELYYSRFLVVITYLELTDITLKIIEGTISKKRTKDLNITNKSRFNVIHVNTNWNTTTINLNTFDVKGHWRLQPCGVGRSQFKYTWIKPYQKGLIKRLAQKELI